MAGKAEKKSLQLPEKQVQSLQAAFAKGSFSELAGELQETLHSQESVCLNVGVTGEQGAGKSTLINSIRDLRQEEAGAAPVGGVGPSKDPRAYSHPKYANVVLWDLPSIGAPGFKPKVYLEEITVSRYDFFVILAAQRFAPFHAKLARYIKQAGKDFYFVRSKVDVDMEAALQSQPSGFAEAATLQNIRDGCVQDLQAAGAKTPRVFLISSFLFGKYDFPLLAQALGQDLDPGKSYAFLLATPNISHRIVEKKKESMVEHMWLVAVVACGVNAAPIPRLSIVCDVDLLAKTLRGYCVDFGLEDASLRKVAEHMEQPLEMLTALVKSPLASQVTPAVVGQRLMEAAIKAPNLPKELLSCAPILESVDAVGMSFAIVYHMLKDFVDDAAADAHRILVKGFMSQRPGSAADLQAARSTHS
ncbi:intelectin-1 isoform X1 [Hemicordylus capensis]|uniref:intelectin-1 isoform X1 n=1 Tax=Hemicordylus capensis TaxID=884348 RepID=UPI0023034F31|nr:intelectin-1 isoform X1 [Hemicordylus capensis]